MSCCICNRAGHDEELHGEEGVEILELRERVILLDRVAEAAQQVYGFMSESNLKGVKALGRALKAAQRQSVAGGKP